MKRFWMLLWVCVLPVSVLAQDDICPAIVDDALTRIDRVCSDIGRNQVCYGSPFITVEPYPDCTAPHFASPGDRADITTLQTLHLSEMNTSTAAWGIAVMKVQANLPNALPGQNSTILLFGDVDLANGIRPLVAGQPAYIHTTEGDSLNVRSGPGLGYDIVTALPNGANVSVLSGPTDADGLDWWQIQAGRSVGWVVQDVDDQNVCLTTLTRDPGVNQTPMQAFYFRSGIGDAACATAPESGILIQTPSGTQRVELAVNTVNLTFASTAYLQAQPGGEMVINVLDGQVTAEAFGVRQTASTGQRIRVPLDSNLQAVQAPHQPEPVNLNTMQMLPVGLLPQAVNLTPSSTTQPQLGTGDLQVTLRWDNLVDMDLYVIGPANETISYQNDHPASGGQLDVDSNYPCGSNTHRVENIFWDTGTAPRGEYRVWATEYDRCGAGQPANWTIEVRVDGQLVLSETGTGSSPEYVFER